MGYYISIAVFLNDELGIRSVVIENNDTSLPNDSELIRKLATTLLKSINANKESLMIQDLLNESDVALPEPN